MAIRIAHGGQTAAMSGAAGLFLDEERRRDRRGAVAASAAASSINASRADRTRRLALFEQGVQADRERAFRAQQAELSRQHDAGRTKYAATQRAMEAARNRRFQALSQLQRQGFERGGRMLDQQFRGDQAELDRGLRRELLDRAGAQRADLEDQRLEQLELRGEYDLDAEIIEGLRTGELELPESARNRLRQLNSSLSEADGLTPEQQEEFYDQYNSRRRALLRSAQPPVIPEMPIEERFSRDTFVGPDGNRYQRTEKGFEILSEPSDPGSASRDAIEKRARELMSQTDENLDPVYPSMGDALRAAQREQEEINLFFNEPGIDPALENGREAPLQRPAEGDNVPSGGETVPQWQSLKSSFPESSGSLGRLEQIYGAGDQETRTAVNVITSVLEIHGGAAPQGSADERAVIQAMRVLHQKGVYANQLIEKKRKRTGRIVDEFDMGAAGSM